MFQDLPISWKGKEYMVRAQQMMRALASVEQHLTAHELHAFSVRGTVPVARIASAYSALLRVAGCVVTPEEVYFDYLRNLDSDRMQEAVLTLLMMFTPPDDLIADFKKDKGALPENPSKAVVNSSSKRSSRRSSKRSGLQPATSGT